MQGVTRPSIVLERGVSGRVKWFDFSKGYGFITRDDGGQDVFLHASSIVRKVNMYFVLIEGQRVEFDVIDGEKGREAAAVSGPGGIRVGTAIQHNNTARSQPLPPNANNSAGRMFIAGRFRRPVGKPNNKVKSAVASVPAVVSGGDDSAKGPPLSLSGVTRKGRRMFKANDGEKGKTATKRKVPVTGLAKRRTTEDGRATTTEMAGKRKGQTGNRRVAAARRERRRQMICDCFTRPRDIDNFHPSTYC
ncbi:hypothetical protein niasHT_002512 [Heterodera trifolii]|uniref:CSD domain-containing protein n=1 Tax=Heterodera trifolii TaxID=157864 RepID=A0ABD2M805_9BILA